MKILFLGVEKRWFRYLHLSPSGILSYTHRAVAGFRTERSNLLYGTTYYYRFEVLGADKKELITQSGEFTIGTPNGIVETRRSTSLPEITDYYNLSGVRLPKEPKEPEKGVVYIITYDNGTVEKVVRVK